MTPHPSSLLGMMLAPVPEGVDEAALWAHANALRAKIRRGAYHTKRRRRKALRRFHAAHHEAGKVMFAKIGAEARAALLSPPKRS